jgi:hypothetical protein
VYVDDFVDDDGDVIADDFSVKAQPDSWNTNYANNSNGSVSFKLSADGDSSVADIDQDSIEITIDGSTAPSTIRRQGPNLRLILSKADAFALIDNPVVGEEYTAEVSFALESGATIAVTDTIRVVGPEDDDSDSDVVVDVDVEDDDINEEDETITVTGDDGEDVDVHIDDDTEIIVIDPATQETVSISISVFFQIVIENNISLDLDLLTTVEGTFALEIYLEFNIGDLPEDDDDGDDEDFDVVDSDVSDVDDENDTFTVSDDDGEPIEISVEEDTEIVAVDPETEETVMLSIDVFFQLLAQGDITVSVDFELDIDIAIALSIQISIDLDTLPEDNDDDDFDVVDSDVSDVDDEEDTFTVTDDDGEPVEVNVEEDTEIIAVDPETEETVLLSIDVFFQLLAQGDITVSVDFELDVDIAIAISIQISIDLNTLPEEIPDFALALEPTERPLNWANSTDETFTATVSLADMMDDGTDDSMDDSTDDSMDDGTDDMMDDGTDDSMDDMMDDSWLENINLDSLSLSLAGVEGTVVAVEVTADGMITALFSQVDAFSLLEEPAEDDVVTVTVSFEYGEDAEVIELTQDVTIVAAELPEFTASLDATEWPLAAWETSEEVLTLEILSSETTGITLVDTESVSLSVLLDEGDLEDDSDDTYSDTLVSADVSTDEDVTLTALFTEADVFGLFTELPATDSILTVKVSFTLSEGTELEQMLDVTVVEPVVEPALVVSETELVTDETGTEASFSVSLATEPTEPVTVTLTTDEEEGVDPEVALSAETLEFDATNWDVPVDVTVTGQDDEDTDGDVSVVVTLTATSNDADYEGLTADVTVSNEDDEVVVVVAAITVTPTELITDEAFTVGSFDVSLATEPTDTVTITITNPDDEGELSVTELTFDASNFADPQTVEVQGTDDDVVDGDVNYDLTLDAASADLNYDGLAATVSVTNNDNDEAVTPTP